MSGSSPGEAGSGASLLPYPASAWGGRAAPHPGSASSSGHTHTPKCQSRRSGPDRGGGGGRRRGASALAGEGIGRASLEPPSNVRPHVGVILTQRFCFPGWLPLPSPRGPPGVAHGMCAALRTVGAERLPVTRAGRGAEGGARGRGLARGTVGWDTERLSLLVCRCPDGCQARPSPLSSFLPFQFFKLL